LKTFYTNCKNLHNFELPFHSLSAVYIATELTQVYALDKYNVARNPNIITKPITVINQLTVAKSPYKYEKN